MRNIPLIPSNDSNEWEDNSTPSYRDARRQSASSQVSAFFESRRSSASEHQGYERRQSTVSQSASPPLASPALASPDVTTTPYDISTFDSTFGSVEPLVSPVTPAYRQGYTSINFDENTGYASHSINNAQPQQQGPNIGRNRSIISRFGSFRIGRASSQKRYGRLDDQNNAQETELGTVREEDDRHSINMDISGLTGNDYAMADWSKGKVVETTIAPSPVPSSLQPGQGRLGSGMGTIKSRTVPERLRNRGHRRASSTITDPSVQRQMQQEAERSGHIVEYHEEVIDISNLDGQDRFANNAAPPKAFAFPDDPEQPDWKPFSMRWPYIVGLIIIALGLAGLQEYLCQRSESLAKDNKGLLTFKEPKEIGVLEYFTWKYLPTMILVTYGVMWQVTDYEVKRLEPYYQLSRKTGATAATSLNLDYLTFLSYLIPVKALWNKQWAVLCSSIASLAAGGLLAILQSAAVEMLPERNQRREREDKFVRVQPGWSRALEGTLIAIALLGIVLLVQLRRKSGLLSNPQGIAGVAAMATKSHITGEFQGLDRASNKVIHAQLRTRRYNLHKSSLWQGQYLRAAEKVKPQDDEHPHPAVLRVPAGIAYICAILAAMAIIPVFVFIGPVIDFSERIPWFLTACATGIKLIWVCLDMNVRVIEPYYILWKRNAPPKTLTLDYTGMVPGQLTFMAARNGHWLVAVVSVGAILAEILTVCVASFSVDGRSFISGWGHRDLDGAGGSDEDHFDRNNTSETFRSFWISFGLAMGILLYLGFATGFVLLRRRHKFLPRQPGTIAGVLAYIHQSKMLDDFVNTERLTAKQMTAHLESKGKTYGLGTFAGRDQKRHCGVEQEPLLSGYTHGVDPGDGVVMGDELWRIDMY